MIELHNGDCLTVMKTIADKSVDLILCDPPYGTTQKPVPLLEWLVKTYSKEGDVVLDNCMGSGSTGVAAVMNDRSFIGIEKEPEYFQIARDRVNAGASKLKDFLS